MKLIATALLALFAAGDLRLGDVVPDFTIKTHDGKELKLSDFRADKEKKVEGKVVVIYFQSQRCPAAVKPEVTNKVAAEYADGKSGVKFIAAFAYGHDKEDELKKWAEENKVAHAWAFDGDRKIRDHFGAKKVNATFVLDRDGKLVYRGGCGVKEENLLQDAVKAALTGGKAPESDKKFAG